MQETGMPLADKIRLSLDRIRRTTDEYAAEKTAVAWTGGKDSTTLLHLVLQVWAERGRKEPVVAMNVDTGVKFPEVISFRNRLTREWMVDLRVLQPAADVTAYPLAVDPVACCRDLKITPLQRGIGDLGVEALFTGIRFDEHESRRDRSWRERCDEPSHVRIHPLLHWSEMDVWAYHMQESLPYCSLYEQGYRSLGCIPCTEPATGESERSGRSATKENRLEVLRSLGYF